MSKEKLKEKLNNLGFFFEDIYWEINPNGNAMIMFDEPEGEQPDDIWDICYHSGFREDYLGNIIEIQK